MLKINGQRFGQLPSTPQTMAYLKEHGSFPPKIAAFLKGWQPPEQL
jgi:hypothetical protein